VDALTALMSHPGLVVFTILALALVIYLTYSMIHPESF
jgi:K+-transporting ATPase KdpF subunit